MRSGGSFFTFVLMAIAANPDFTGARHALAKVTS
jgi:hypothetical protein